MRLSIIAALATGALLLASPVLPGADAAVSCRKKATQAPAIKTLTPKTSTSGLTFANLTTDDSS
ncbi:hypothetical protein Gpo141_00014090, partial [Globisporangium polare]